MIVAITLSATTVADRKSLHAIVSAYAGEQVTLTEDGAPAITGTLTVGAYLSGGDRDGFAVNVYGYGSDFVATAVWSDDACGTLANRTLLHVG